MLLSPHPDLLPEGEGTNIKDWSVHPLPMGEGRGEGIQKIKKNQTLAEHPLPTEAGMVIRDWLGTLSPWERAGVRESKNVSTSVT